MFLVQFILSAFLFIAVGLTISAGIGLLIWSPLYKLIYESFLIKDPDSTIKRIWNFFYHVCGGGLSYFFYFWLIKKYKLGIAKLVFLLYLIAFISIGIPLATVGLAFIEWLFS
ncbi:hypothetical protein [Shouchella miscanthi]|uniref:Uncharacterized protein n=1 Tax=Shouchella miscanthi TaxID=2598861 RepID=A0ABU6NI84_9BACI|nr:hypothetical protein [Shouchella miscanthi]